MSCYKEAHDRIIPTKQSLIHKYTGTLRETDFTTTITLTTPITELNELKAGLRVRLHNNDVLKTEKSFL